jgi:dephospho-CoA kinase
LEEPTTLVLPDEIKRRQADFVNDTGMGMEAARREVRSIVAQLRGEASQ